MKAKARISLIILAISLLIAAVFAVSASAEADSYIKVSRFNVSYGEKLAIVVAVDVSADHTGLKLEVYGEEPAEGVAPIYTVTESDLTEIEGKTYSVFMMRGVPAKNIYDEYYVKAVSDIGESAALQYSIIEYLYEMLNVTEGVTDVQKTFFEYVMGYGEYAVRVIDEAEPTKYAYAYSDATDFADRLVTLGSSLTPTVSGAYSVLKDGEEVATVAAGEGYVPTEAGAYEFAIKAPEKTVETFEGLSVSTDWATNYGTASGSLSTLVQAGTNDSDGQYLLVQNKVTSTRWLGTTVADSDTSGANYCMEFSFRYSSTSPFEGVSAYSWNPASGVSGGTDYAVILEIKSTGAVYMNNVDTGIVLTADTWHDIRIERGVAAEAEVTVYVDGTAAYTATAAKAISGVYPSVKFYVVKAASGSTNNFHLDNIGVNFYD